MSSSQAFKESAGYFPTPLQQFQFYDKYARWSPALGRRETWVETVDRAVSYLRELSEHRLSDDTYQMIRLFILEMKSMPSMRLLAMAGDAARRDSTAIYNCLRRDTRFVTADGVKSFADFSDGDETTVLTHAGNWRRAVVRSYGKQAVSEVSFSRMNNKQSVFATKNHRWLLSDGSETTALSSGNGIPLPPLPISEWKYEDAEPMEKLYWAYGFVFGDGTRVRNSSGNYAYSMVRLCGEKAVYKERFEELGFKTSAPLSAGGDFMAYTGSYLKTLPDISVDGVDLVRAFVVGYLDADGAKGKGSANKYTGIYVSDANTAKWVRSVFPAVGAYIVGERNTGGEKTNMGVRPEGSTLFSLLTGSGNGNNSIYYARDISSVETVETVWCLDVDDDHSFVLDGGIVTGNCSYLPVDSLDAFVEALSISMAGCGVGFSVERRNIDKLPKIKRQREAKPMTFTVPDSAEGWAFALRVGLHAWFDGLDVEFDYSQVRPAGAPLMTKGGRASGPAPLKRMLDFARMRILARQGGYLRSVDAHDIVCEIGNAAVSGGVRRTAMISLFDLEDEIMMHAKDGDFSADNPQRWNANNSVVIEKAMSRADFDRLFDTMLASERGEPGIFSRTAGKRMAPKRRNTDYDFGMNPSLRAGTRVYTSDGVFPIESLSGKDFKTRNLRGEISDAKCFLSGNNKELYKIVLSGGHEIYSTKEHKWPVVSKKGGVKKVTTDELSAGDNLPVLERDSFEFGNMGTRDEGFLCGWLLGDGWVTTRSDNGKRQVGLILSKADYDAGIGDKLVSALSSVGSEAQFYERIRGESTWFELNTQNDALSTWMDKFGIRGKGFGLPSSVWSDASEDFRRGVVDGLISSDGNVDTKRQAGYVSIGFTSAHESLAKDLSDLLGFYGIGTEIRKVVSKNTFDVGKASGSEYTYWQIRVNRQYDVVRFSKIFGISHPDKAARMNLAKVKRETMKGAIRVVSVEKTDLREDVWDISVYDETHCFPLAHCVTGNCGEILLRPHGFCNLSVAVARQDDSLASLKAKVEIATIIGTIQSMATHFPNLRDIWRKNAEEERLLGVDITGQMDCPVLTKDVFDELREHAIAVNKRYASILGINQSVSVTCVKPSGNSAVLLDSSSGIHPRFAPYYIRRVRVNANTPMFQVLRGAGVPLVPENGQTIANATTWVASFPVKAPDYAKTRADLTALDQCHWWEVNKLHWTEHNPSVTIYYGPDEVDGLREWVWTNLDIIGGMTFLPRSDAKFDNMPYEEITEEKYNELLAAFPAIDFSWLEIYESADMTEAAQLLACVAGGDC